MNVEAVDVDVETLSEQHVAEGKADVQMKRRPRFFKRLIAKLKIFTRRPRRRNPVSYQDSFYCLPPTPDIPSFASSYAHY